MSTHSARRLRRALAVGLTALTAATLTACMSTSAEAPGGGSGDSASIKLVIGPVFYEPVRIAEKEGLFEKEDLDVEVVGGSGTAAENAAQLVSGQVDIAMSGGVSIIQGAVEGLGVRAILGATSSDPEVATSGIVATPDSGIQDCGDLENKTVALQGLNETTHLGTLLCAQEAGIDPESITFVQLPLPNLNDAVLSGEVDAAYTIGSFWGAGLDAGLVQIATPSSNVLAYGPSVVYAAADSYVEENPELIERFQRTMIKAHELARADDFALVREVQLEYSDLDPEYIKTAPLAGYQTDLYRSGLQATLDGMFEFGFIAEELAVEDVVSPAAPLVD